MDQFKTLQEFIVAWMDELWYSLRDRVGALSMIESLQNSWKAAGQKVGELAKSEGLTIAETAKTAHHMLGRTVTLEGNTLIVTTCPIWDRILTGNLEYGLRCEEFVCAPYLDGMKGALNAKEAIVETNLRLAYVKRAQLEYKLSKLKSQPSEDSKAQNERKVLQKQLDQLPKSPACVFRVK
ncbi:MAG: hypothetical protein ACFE89_01455 [Candidatus Hodarchaeota archaeon]